MNDIFEEINSELQQERFISLFKKYAITIIMVIILLIISSVSYICWQSYLKNKAMQNGEIYYNIRNLEKTNNNESLIEESLTHLMKKNDSGYFVLGAFKKAQLLEKSQNYPEMIKVYDLLAQNNKVDMIIKDLAKLMAANIIIANNFSDYKIEERLEQLTNKQNNFYSSGIMLKALMLKNQKKVEELASFIKAVTPDVEMELQKKLKILME
jgi:hypothetical protein